MDLIVEDLLEEALEEIVEEVVAEVLAEALEEIAEEVVEGLEAQEVVLEAVVVMKRLERVSLLDKSNLGDLIQLRMLFTLKSLEVSPRNLCEDFLLKIIILTGCSNSIGILSKT